MTSKTWRGRVVPYFTLWAEGEVPDFEFVVKRGRITYGVDLVYDRAIRGLLWLRAPVTRGGEWDWRGVRPARQRRSQQRLLCQMCGGPADEEPQLGALFLLEDGSEDRPDWPEAEPTVRPVLCLGCAPLSAVQCPHLRRVGAVAVRAKASEVSGVGGGLYVRGGRSVVCSGERVDVTYGGPLADWVLAAQRIRILYGCTIVDLPALRTDRQVAA